MPILNFEHFENIMKKSITASLFAIVALAPAASFASDGTITFNGEITSATCVINGGTPSFTVTLPKVSTSAFSNASTKAGETVFQIDLTSCTENRGVRAFFERGANDFNGSGALLKNNGTAQNVAVELLSYNGNAAGSTIVTGTADQGGFITIANGAATVRYTARYARVNNTTPTAGTVTTSVTYTLQFM